MNEYLFLIIIVTNLKCQIMQQSRIDNTEPRKLRPQNFRPQKLRPRKLRPRNFRPLEK